MVYVIVDSEKKNDVLVVKANCETTIKENLILKDGMEIIARLTDEEMRVLSASDFAVLSS